MTSAIVVAMLADNYAYLHPCGDGLALAVDPGEASPILRVMEERAVSLAAVLTTHHHWDHVGGVAELRSKTGCEVIGVDRSLIPAADRIVAGGDVLTVGQTQINVMATPGHTQTSMSYHIEPQPGGTPGVIFTGDTLFVGGCGRLLECDALTMWESLRKLRSLPAETLVYCGHNYAMENYEFATAVAPDDRRFRDRLVQVQRAIEYGQPTVPSTIAQERAANIFLRADDPQVKAAAGMPDAEPHEVFAELRRRKDLFG
ncbi:MAG: hydroxyacylglutathione hydrolase [Phycisphaerales bacterium]|jgi:hydroxyacylglutathione hydrolase